MLEGANLTLSRCFLSDSQHHTTAQQHLFIYWHFDINFGVTYLTWPCSFLSQGKSTSL